MDRIDVPIVLRASEDGKLRSVPGQVPVTDRADDKRLEAAIALVTDSITLKKLRDCPLKPWSVSDKPVVWIEKRTSRSRTALVIDLADSAFARFGAKGVFNDAPQGYPFGAFFVVNALPAPCPPAS